MIGLIRVISTLTPSQFASHADALAPLLREEIVTRAIPDQPEGVHDDATFEAAVGKVVAVGTQLRAEGARLIIVSCAADPGVAELRAALDIPVIGAGSAGAAVARAFGGTVGVLGIVPEVPEAISHGLGVAMIASRVPAGVHQTRDLLRPSAREAALVSAQQLADAGAGSILFACTGLTTIGLAADVTQRTGLPVVDAVLAAGAVAAYPSLLPPTIRPREDQGAS